LKLELTPREGNMLIAAAERYLRDLRLELPDFEELEAVAGMDRREFDLTSRNREALIAGLLRRLRG
jgi:hypothetical protein